MNLTTTNSFSATSWTNKVYSLFAPKLALKSEQPVDDTDARVGSLMHAMVGEEKSLAKKALEDLWRRYPVSIIGGGALNVGVLALEGTSAFVTCSMIADLLVGVVVLGGLFNLREGVLAIEEGMRAWKTNDKKLAARLFLQGALEIALGAAMLLMSIARIFALTSITAAFLANPYILPTLFFCLSLFLLAEVLNRLIPVAKGTDLGSKLELHQLRTMLQQKDPEKRMKDATEWVHSKIPECFKEDPANRSEAVHRALNRYKAEIGFTAGTEACQLFEMILKNKRKEEILQQIEIVEAKIAEWNRTLYLKLSSVLIAAAGFTAGMSAIATESATVDGGQNFAMATSGMVPLYLDVTRPFEREIPIVIHRPQKNDHQDAATAKTDLSVQSPQGSAA